MNNVGLLTLFLNSRKQVIPSVNGDLPASIHVCACTLKELFSAPNPFRIEIPEYQRSYVWNEDKLEALLEDLEGFFGALKSSQGQPVEKFYMGTILLHQKGNNVLSIIDGQQRITTLLILDYIVNKKQSVLQTQSKRLTLEYSASESKRNILNNKKYIENALRSRGLESDCADLLEKIAVTSIVTKSEDDAFTFFDTQNTKGVQLSATDFLKSYHLRELKGREDLQRRFAGMWDQANQNQALELLFDRILWRGRNWKGKNLYYENKDHILLEFQKRTLKGEAMDCIAIYPNLRNTISSNLSFAEQLSIVTDFSFPLQIDSPLRYPFTLRQPIQKGIGFFLFTERYHRLFEYIFLSDNSQDLEIAALLEFYKSVYCGVSDYLRELYELCIILYYDKFENYKLFAFGLWLDYLIGSYRIFQNNIVAQTPVKILREKDSNLLDIVHGAFLPEEIFRFVESITEDAWYKDENVADGNGVQARYKRQIKAYYKRSSENSLANKKQWLNEKIREWQ